jgi:DNA-binding NarL/FixJ family response regulator
MPAGVLALARPRHIGEDRPLRSGCEEGPVFVRVAIADPLPIYRQGLRSVLQEDTSLALDLFDSRTPNDLRDWIQRDERTVVLVTVESAGDWELLAEVRRLRADAIIVAVLTEPSVGNQVRALGAGAVATVARDATPDEVRTVVRAAARGQSLLGVEVLRTILAAREVPVREIDEPTDDEMAWLRQLAHGGTVVDLARRSGYSERMMFRLLRDLYAKLGVENRSGALLRARDRGWV